MFVAILQGIAGEDAKSHVNSGCPSFYPTAPWKSALRQQSKILLEMTVKDWNGTSIVSENHGK